MSTALDPLLWYYCQSQCWLSEKRRICGFFKNFCLKQFFSQFRVDCESYCQSQSLNTWQYCYYRHRYFVKQILWCVLRFGCFWCKKAPPVTRFLSLGCAFTTKRKCFPPNTSHVIGSRKTLVHIRVQKGGRKWIVLKLLDQMLPSVWNQTLGFPTSLYFQVGLAVAYDFLCVNIIAKKGCSVSGVEAVDSLILRRWKFWPFRVLLTWVDFLVFSLKIIVVWAGLFGGHCFLEVLLPIDS